MYGRFGMNGAAVVTQLQRMVLQKELNYTPFLISF
jgi:hypothetical protein